MRILIKTTLLSTLAVTGLGLSGCSQISSIFKGKSKTTTSAQQATTLRTTPTQDYGFGNDAFEVDLYEAPVNYAGYEVVLYSPQPSYQSTPVDPRDAAFVKLNGQSEAADWRNCETAHRGYLFISEYDFTLDPNFEVCMRNKGYVLSAEAGGYGSNPISAQTAGLRGYSASTYPTSSSYSYP